MALIDQLVLAIPTLTAIEEGARRARNAIRRVADLKKGGVRQVIALEVGDADSEVPVADEQLDAQLTKAVDAITAIKRDVKTLN